MKKAFFIPFITLLLSACAPSTNPSTAPSVETSSEPSVQSTTEPSVEPTIEETLDPTTEPSIEESVTQSVEVPTTKVQSFYHKFEQEDFNKDGGTLNINGVNFTYSAFSFLGGSTQGVQIGSKNSPQTTAWTLSTSFDETIKITSFYFEVANASSGSGIYSYSFGDYLVETEFNTNRELLKYGEENLSVETSSLTFSLTSIARAIYFYSLSFTVETSIDSTIELSGDTYIANPVVPGENSIPATNYTLISKEEYYKDVNLNTSKEELKTSLNTLVSTMTRTSYGDARTMLQYVDEHPTEKGYLYGAYDGDLIPAKWDSGASWNREHVWACAHMKLNGKDARPDESTKSHATDLHNLRVACQMANGAHGDMCYDELGNSGAFYPNISSSLIGYHQYSGDFRGDTARILFYMVIRYDGLSLTSNMNEIGETTLGVLSTLLEWNKLDPVDEFETQRNNRIYEYQGNRNPFIDYSNIADIIFA